MVAAAAAVTTIPDEEVADKDEDEEVADKDEEIIITIMNI
jgi:hypothetical protein